MSQNHRSVTTGPFHTVGSGFTVVTPCPLRTLPLSVTSSNSTLLIRQGMLFLVVHARTELNKGNSTTGSYHPEVVIVIPNDGAFDMTR